MRTFEVFQTYWKEIEFLISVLKVDVTTVKPVPAFCSSDEEGEDNEVLQFLPIAPEVEDPEEGPAAMMLGGGALVVANSGSPPSKRPRYQAFEINLQGAPVDGESRQMTNSCVDCASDLCSGGSEPLIYKLGVPQGSVLSPESFLTMAKEFDLLEED